MDIWLFFSGHTAYYLVCGIWMTSVMWADRVFVFELSCRVSYQIRTDLYFLNHSLDYLILPLPLACSVLCFIRRTMYLFWNVGHSRSLFICLFKPVYLIFTIIKSEKLSIKLQHYTKAHSCYPLSTAVKTELNTSICRALYQNNCVKEFLCWDYP